MTIIEFYAKPENGSIKIPEQFQQNIKDTVKVVMYYNEELKILSKQKFFESIKTLNIKVPSSFTMNKEELYE